jgi:hypothetical protein
MQIPKQSDANAVEVSNWSGQNCKNWKIHIQSWLNSISLPDSSDFTIEVPTASKDL